MTTRLLLEDSGLLLLESGSSLALETLSADLQSNASLSAGLSTAIHFSAAAEASSAISANLYLAYNPRLYASISTYQEQFWLITESGNLILSESFSPIVTEGSTGPSIDATIECQIRCASNLLATSDAKGNLGTEVRLSASGQAFPSIAAFAENPFQNSLAR